MDVTYPLHRKCSTDHNQEQDEHRPDSSEASRLVACFCHIVPLCDGNRSNDVRDAQDGVEVPQVRDDLPLVFTHG